MMFRRHLQTFGRLLMLALALAWVATSFAATVDPAAKKPGTARPTQANDTPGDIMLTQVRLDEAVRLLAQVGRANIVVTGKVSDALVSLYLRNSSVDDMIRNLCRAAGVWYRYDNASKTYIIMSGDEYQKDLAIVRDEQTKVFTLRHHNVVSTANAIKALFGSRVQLNTPVEEMPPVSLGSGTRTTTGGSRSGSGTSSSSSRSSGASGSGSSGLSDLLSASGGSTSTRGGGSSGGASVKDYDPAADLARLSQDRLSSQMRGGEATVSITEIQELAARQGPPVYVTYNKLNNLLLVRTGDEAALKQIGLLIADMDKPPRQVLLEMQILEVTLDSGFKSVFDISYAKGTASSSAAPLTGSTSTARTSAGSGNFDVEDDATFSWQVLGSNLSARLQLMAEENKLKVLSSPMLVAANNQPARLFIGDERVLTVGASSSSTTGTTGATNTTITVETEKRDVGQTLSILPRINGDRSVSLTIDQDSSTVKVGDTTIPISTSDGDIYYFPIDTVNTATLQVTAHAKDGMTVAIGGMIKDSTQFDEQKVPVLGDIPVLGTLFKRDVRAAERTQIVLLITPRVLENPQESEAVAKEKTRGYEELTGTFPNKPVVPTFADFTDNRKDAAAPNKAVSDIPVREELKGADATYAALARAAATAVRQTDPTAAAPDGLQVLPIADRRTLALANGMQAKVAGSWTRDGLYVTALQVINTSSLPDGVAPTLIRGRWSAMVLEKTRLEGAGNSESWTWAYAVSRQPFEQAVDRP